MLQRIQTVFLLLAFAAFTMLFLLPFATSDSPGTNLMADKVFNIQDHAILLTLCSAGALLAIVNIFKYNNRNTQVRLNYLLIVIAILLIVLSFVLFLQEGEEWLNTAQVEDQAGAYMPFSAILFAALANYFIKKDEKKIRSAYDRLR